MVRLLQWTGQPSWNQEYWEKLGSFKLGLMSEFSLEAWVIKLLLKFVRMIRETFRSMLSGIWKVFQSRNYSYFYEMQNISWQQLLPLLSPLCEWPAPSTLPHSTFLPPYLSSCLYCPSFFLHVIPVRSKQSVAPLGGFQVLFLQPRQSAIPCCLTGAACRGVEAAGWWEPGHSPHGPGHLRSVFAWHTIGLTQREREGRVETGWPMLSICSFLLS